MRHSRNSHLGWHFVVFLQVLDGAGGSGDGAPAWPTYEVPSGVGTGAGERQPDSDPARPTSTSRPADSRGEPPPAASDDGAAGSTAAGQPPPPPGTASPSLPPGRLDERSRRQAGEIAQLRRQLTELGAYAPTLKKLQEVFAPAAPTEDPKTLALRNRILEVLPGLDKVLKLAEKTGDIDRLLSTDVPQYRESTANHWRATAQRTMATVYGQLAPYVVGPEGTPDQLSPDQRDYIQEQFQLWCLPRTEGGRAADGSRVQRYEEGDPKLQEEFRDWYVGINYGAARRSTAARAATRAAAGAAAPRGGRADATTTPVPPPNPADEDAIHKHGWQAIQAAAARR